MKKWGLDHNKWPTSPSAYGCEDNNSHIPAPVHSFMNSHFWDMDCHCHKMCSNKSTCNMTCVVELVLSVWWLAW